LNESGNKNGASNMKNVVKYHYDTIADSYDDRSNKYCNGRYLKEVTKHLHQNDIIIEIGCGSGVLLSQLMAAKKIGCDLSFNFIKMMHQTNVLRIQADAETVPLKSEYANIVYHINLLEHVPEPDRVIREGMRLIKTGGRQIIITPNGDLGAVLKLAEKLHLKIPEGPHRFLKTKEFKRIISGINARVIEFKKMVISLFGPRTLQSFGEVMETVVKIGFFHLIVLEKTDHADKTSPAF